MACRKGELLGAIVVVSHTGDARVDQRRKPTIFLSTERYTLLGERPSSGRPEDPFPGQDQPDRAVDQFGRCRGQDVMAPDGLVAETAADEGREHTDLFIFEAEHRSESRLGKV